MTVYEIAQQFRAQLLDKESKGASQIVDVYGEAWKRVDARLRSWVVTERNAKVRLATRGHAGGGAWSEQAELGVMGESQQRQAQLRRVLAEIEAELRYAAQFAERTIIDNQREAVNAASQLGFEFAGSLREQAPGIELDWNTVPQEVAEQLVGQMADGSPLVGVLQDMSGGATRDVRAVLLAGIKTGTPLRTLAKNLRNEFGVPLARALTVSRTEVLRAYREATIAQYATNPDVVQRWRWQASHSLRTCAMCIAMSGREFPVTTPFGSHPNCRCMPVPVTRSWASMGFPDIEDEPPPESGSEWFDGLNQDQQEQILGPAKAKAYREGRIDLRDLIGYRDDADWGPCRWERGLRDVESRHKGVNARAAGGAS